MHRMCQCLMTPTPFGYQNLPSMVTLGATSHSFYNSVARAYGEDLVRLW